MIFDPAPKAWLRNRFRWPLTSLALAALAVLCSCAHRDGPRFAAGTGDAGQFIVQQAVFRGGRPITTNALPAVTGAWRYAADNSGVIIRLSRNDYPAVEALLQHAFGQPNFGPIDTANGGRFGGYRLTRKGAAVQFGRDADWTQVIVLRQRTDEETAAQFLQSLQ